MRDLSVTDIVEILKIVGAVLATALGFLAKRWLKLERDIRAAHDKIRKLEEPKCPEVTCPIARRHE